ncbi:MAG: hypothetical protein JOZ05_21570 [Acetobacteraceae bacterium]|nr:hypothetical protein [Acetobacteraceae bacterium]
MAPDASPIVIESVTGRFMTLVAGDLFLATPGFRESTRWVVGHVPPDGLQPGPEYRILADSGLVGVLEGASVLPKAHLGRARLLGVLNRPGGGTLNLADVATLAGGGPKPDRGVPVTAVLGTSSEVGKTTACLAILQTMISRGLGNVIALKATGTASVQETARYADFGARQTFDCVDFGLPTTYPSGRDGIAQVFETALDHLLAMEADSLLVECGGDLFGANVPVFLEALQRRRPAMKAVVAAADAAAALGSKTVLEGMGIDIAFFTGPCTDTSILQARTERLCQRPAINLLGGADALAAANPCGEPS